MRLPLDAHAQEPWQVHALARDFQLLDVWQYPVRIDDRVPFSAFLDFLAQSQAQLMEGRGAAASLFRLRELLGRWFGWDDQREPLPIPGCSEATLRDRLGPLGPEPAAGGPEPNAGEPAAAEALGELSPFTPVYRVENEALLEISNTTVHALLHLGRVAQAGGCWAPRMAVYVKPRGWAGSVYMAAISPFRHWVVYPAMMRAVARGWPRHARQMEWPEPAAA